MTISVREIASAVARSRAGSRRAPKLPAMLTGDAASYLRILKARGAEVGVWEIRGRVFARVMAAGRDARLSGAEWSVLTTVALHLQHLGRSKGMMSVAKLADDCMVTERTIRNALRVLEASKFLSVKYRLSGQMTVMLDRRFGPRAVVPGDKSVDKSPRRCAPRKKISTNRNSNVPLSFLLKDECKDSAARTARAESTSSVLKAQTATGNVPTIKTTPHDAPGPKLAVSDMDKNCKQTIERKNSAPPQPRSARRRDPGSCLSASKLAVSKSDDPPRKRAAPVASG